MNGNKNKLSYGIKFAAFFLVIIAIAAVALYSPYSFASKNNIVTKAGFSDPFIYINDNAIDLNNEITQRDTTSIKKGKRTIKFYEGEGENRKRYKAKMNNGKLEELYVDGEEIPENELSQYESKIQKRVDEYDSLLKEYKNKKKEYKELLKDYSEKLDDYRDKLREYKTESHTWNNDFDFDFDISEPDMSELRESMRELREELRDEFADGSFHVPPVPPIHIPPIHIPPINIPPIPPIHFNDDEWNSWREEFKANMEKFREDMKEHKWDMEEFKENMKHFGKEMKVFGVEMKKFGEFIHEAKDELIKDGIINDEDDIDQFILSEKKMEVNDKELSPELHKKYLEMYEKHTGKKLEGKHKIVIND